MAIFIKRIRPNLLLAALCGSILLSGCESAEEKAERHFQSGIALLAQGDEERALIELLNVFKSVEFHKEALRTYADVMMQQGRVAEAHSYYMRLIERHPDMADVRLILAEIAVTNGNWQEAERHEAALAALTPVDPGTRAIGLVLKYREATLQRNEADRARIAVEAAALLNAQREAGHPDNDGLVRIVIDNLAAGDNPIAALPAIDAALERDPQALDLHMLKARLLANAGDRDATDTQLRRMMELFPDNRDIQQALITSYLSQDDVDGAEAFLRELAGDDTADAGGHMNVLQFLQVTRGPEAARRELIRLGTANAGTENGRLYDAMLAMMDFEAGKVEAAIARMRAVLDGAEPGPRTRDHQIALARMLDRTGDRAGAQALVDQVLAEEPAKPSALRLQAGWLIDADKPGEAILALRTALNRNPRDAETLTLMALAHQRNGDIELMGDRLALAVEASDGAPAESLRYARYLIDQGRDRMAVSVLDDARQRAPHDLEVLMLLSSIHLSTKSWPEAQDIAETLRQIDAEEARQASLTLQAAILQGQNRIEDSLALFESELSNDISDTNRQAIRSVILIVQTHIRDGRADEARAYLDEKLASAPDNPDLQLLDANLNALMGQKAQAEAGYRSLIARFPQDELPVQLLLASLSAADRQDDARTVLDEALDRMPASVNLLGLKAGQLEREGNIEEAIKVYETLYARDSGNILVANNLASLLTAQGGSAENLERAYTIARRLRGTKVPAFQDTYGWIEYLRGNYDTALEYLGPAAEALDTNPIVQYHLGMVHVRLGRIEEARAALTRAIDLGGEGLLPQVEEARETLAALSERDG